MRELNPHFGEEIQPGVKVIMTHIGTRQGEPRPRIEVHNGELSHTETLLIDSSLSRDRLIKKVVDVMPEVDARKLNDILIKFSPLAWDLLKEPESQPQEEPEEKVDLDALREQAQSVLDADDPLVLIENALRGLGYGGDLRPAMFVYLAATSRVLKLRPGTMPVHTLLKAPASTGKSYTVNTVMQLLPEEAYHEIDAGSARVIIYDEADLKHRVLLVGESDSIPTSEDSPAASAVRSLLQDNELNYKVVVQDPEGGFMVKDIHKEGPTVLITTAVYQGGSQLMSRLFMVELIKEHEQITEALRTQAHIESHGRLEANRALIAYQLLLQHNTPWDVLIPYVEPLAEEIGKIPASSRVLRDFTRLMSLIKSVTVLRHMHREENEDGRLMATLDDYRVVYELAKDVYAENLTSITPRVKDVVEYVASQEQAISIADVADHLGVTRQTARFHVKKALREGWLVNLNEHQSSGRSYRLVNGDTLPDEIGLPTPEQLEELAGWVRV